MWRCRVLRIGFRCSTCISLFPLCCCRKATGGNLAEILDKLAYVIRERFKLRGRIRAISAHGKMTGIALTCIPMGVAIMMFFVNPEYIKFFFEDELGNINDGRRHRIPDCWLLDYQEDRHDRGLAMGLFLTAFLFVVVMAVITTIGLKFYVRPKEAMDRVAGIAVGHTEHIPSHPSLAIRELLQRLGDVLPASPKDVTVMQRRLIRAGFRGPNALKILYGCKLVFVILLPVLATYLVATAEMETERKIMTILAFTAAGFFGPNQYVKMISQRRQKEIRRGMPNALDLLVVCVESGLGLDQAILQVAKELDHAHPEISEEFALVNLELKAGKRRTEALRNLAERTNVDELKKLVAVLIQADRFGTGIAQSLRGHADFMRVQARQVAEEKAAKLGVKLVFPIFFCILPSLFVVTVGPIGAKIVRELFPMMQGM